MSERLSGDTLLKPDGDIVPSDDIPDAEDLPDNEEIIEDMILASEVEHAEALEGFSDAYRDVVALIEASIKGTPEDASYTVEYKGQTMSLGEFLAGPLFRMGLSDGEPKAILDTYLPLLERITEDDFQAYYDLYDAIEAKNPGGAAEIHKLTQAEAFRRGIAVPPDLS